MLTGLVLREVLADDLPVFFDQMRDPEAVWMAAFVSKDPDDRAAFEAHWARILTNPSIATQTVVVDGAVAGSVGSYADGGRREVTYWIGRDFWGRGIATAALGAFLEQVETRRPLYARAAADNVASIRVLEKCGFVLAGRERGYANARQAEIDEVVMELA